MACTTRVCIFFIIFCIVYYLESIGGTYIISVIQAIEKQFHIPSRWSGALVSAQDIGYVPTVVILSYLGSRGNRARWIGGGCILISVANVWIASPHFLFPETKMRINESYVSELFGNSLHQQDIHDKWQSASAFYSYCAPSINKLKAYIHDQQCLVTKPNTFAYWMVFIGLVCLGIGHSMPWSLGLPLLDDNIKRKSLPTYFAMMFFIKIMGPLTGFMIGAMCNKIYYTLSAPQGLTTLDPRWIGAWWLGFLIVAAMLIIPSIALFAFPTTEKKLVEQTSQVAVEQLAESRTPTVAKRRSLALIDRHHDMRKELARQKHAQDQPTILRKFGAELSVFVTALSIILHQPVYTWSLIGRLIDAFSFKGFHVFLPKYLSDHYGLPQYKVVVLIAIFGVVGFASGVLLGSIIMKKLKLEGRRAAGYVALCNFISSCLSISQMFLACNATVSVIGQHLAMQNTTMLANQVCNSHCDCMQSKLLPVCDVNGNVFYSPCHAGCESINEAIPAYYNCSCASDSGSVSRDLCVDDCKYMIILYFAFAVIGAIIGGMGVVCAILIVLRSVPPEWRSISIGFSGFVVSLGTFAAPVFYGAVVDSACVHSETTCDGGIGSCLIYDPHLLRQRLHMVYGFLRMVGCLFDLVVLYYAKELKLMTSEDDSGENEPANVVNELADDEVKPMRAASFQHPKVSNVSIGVHALNYLDSPQIQMPCTDDTL